jgi:23S rRNA (adenine2030-N6)-methyltransferase
MLSYRHGFHAGNAADVFKHAVLAFCLEYLTQKEKPFLYIDTHAGAGSYSLLEGFAAQNREWEQGIRKLNAPDTVGSPLPVLLEHYHPFMSGAVTETGYPGSPLIAAALLRPGDRAVCFELHPADFILLEETLHRDRRFSLKNDDGLKGLKAFLPPPSRRGLILIDPSYELREEYGAVLSALREALRRFAEGVYIIWYPLLSRTDKGDADFAQNLTDLYPTARRCRIEMIFDPTRKKGMYGYGLVMFNPPWTLRPALEEALPVLASTLGEGKGTWELQWKEGSPSDDAEA